MGGIIIIMCINECIYSLLLFNSLKTTHFFIIIIKIISNWSHTQLYMSFDSLEIRQ